MRVSCASRFPASLDENERLLETIHSDKFSEEDSEVDPRISWSSELTGRGRVRGRHLLEVSVLMVFITRKPISSRGSSLGAAPVSWLYYRILADGSLCN